MKKNKNESTGGKLTRVKMLSVWFLCLVRGPWNLPTLTPYLTGTNTNGANLRLGGPGASFSAIILFPHFASNQLLFHSVLTLGFDCSLPLCSALRFMHQALFSPVPGPCLRTTLAFLSWLPYLGFVRSKSPYGQGLSGKWDTLHQPLSPFHVAGHLACSFHLQKHLFHPLGCLGCGAWLWGLSPLLTACQALDYFMHSWCFP